jgi:two-component system response regulator YesN
MKCIIADDEYLVRFSLQDMLEELIGQGLFHCETMVQASDGDELLALLPKVKPDIVLVDIRMPHMNGLEVMEKGKHIVPTAQWIILTGYAEFDYARKAISLGAIDYLLKPVSKQDLSNALNLAMNNLMDSRLVKQIHLEHRLYGILQDTYSEDPVEQDTQWYSGFVVSIDSVAASEESILLRKQFIQEVRRWLVDAQGLSSTVGVVMLDDGNYAGIIASNTDRDARMTLNRILLHGDAMVRSSEQLRCTWFLFDSEALSFTNVVTSLMEMSKKSWVRIIRGFSSSVTRSSQMLVAGNYLQLEQFVTTFIKLLENRSFESTHTIRFLRGHRDEFLRLWELDGFQKFIHFLSMGTVYGGDAIEAFDRCVVWLSSHVVESEEVLGLKMQRTVGKALELIHDHVNEEIGLAQIADHIGVTPNYLSTIFNRVVGETFPQYITRLRMEKASDLLISGDLTVKDVSSHVGYVSCKHFGKVFKQYFGHTPSEHGVMGRT